MLGNVDELGQSIGVSWIENRFSLARGFASGAVGDSCWRRHFAGTLPQSGRRGEGEKQRQK